MNNSKRWIAFMKVWDTIYASDFEEVGDLICYLGQEIRKIKENKKGE